MIPVVPSEFVRKLPAQYSWNPQEDITAYELALCMRALLSDIWGIEHEIKSLPENAQRHFTKFTESP